MEYVSTGESVKGAGHIKNDDHFLIKNEVGLHMVCDGYGEEGRGAVASQMTTDFISRVMLAQKKVFSDYKIKPTDELRHDITDLVEQAVNKISLQILSMISKDSVRKQMGTTLSMVLVAGDGVFLAHIGNSRIYLLREGSVHILTEDHVRKKTDKKTRIAEDEVNTFGLSTTSLTRMLGASQQLKVDLLYFEVMPGDTLLLCTDGVSNVLDNSKIFEIINETDEANLSKAVLTHAKLHNPNENATAVTISFTPTKKKSATATPQTKFSTLQKIPLFSQFDYKEMTKIMTLMKTKKFKAGEKIVTEGETGEQLFVILSGTADVIVHENIVAELSDSAYFGELSLIDKEPRSATVMAKSDLEALVLERKDFDHLISHEPQVSVKMLWRFAQTLTSRIRHINQGPAEIEKTKNNIKNDQYKNIELKFD